ncbi:predicted protein [Plenodomus lingam JN3]|uniref:Predicted protein n=1 Tax=Leptosphaeria maculans (strain JN3 / isolate v23.1.3 / race Av1-4-5-6-7-8) TaxID=985895 RepID=E4ZLQ7_LEPMJ|nr:predicted protein [Plenodomus lingam JN3]CBX92737.1 predicted protein [Plenodomus lingam JN3]
MRMGFLPRIGRGRGTSALPSDFSLAWAMKAAARGKFCKYYSGHHKAFLIDDDYDDSSSLKRRSKAV